MHERKYRKRFRWKVSQRDESSAGIAKRSPSLRRLANIEPRAQLDLSPAIWATGSPPRRPTAFYLSKSFFDCLLRVDRSLSLVSEAPELRNRTSVTHGFMCFKALDRFLSCRSAQLMTLLKKIPTGSSRAEWGVNRLRSPRRPLACLLAWFGWLLGWLLRLVAAWRAEDEPFSLLGSFAFRVFPLSQSVGFLPRNSTLRSNLVEGQNGSNIDEPPSAR